MESRKRKKVVLTIEDKLKVRELVSDKWSLTSVASELGVGKSTVHDIVKRAKVNFKHFTPKSET